MGTGKLIFRKIIKIVPHKMSYFIAEMHQIRFYLVLRRSTQTQLGSLQRSPISSCWS